MIMSTNTMLSDIEKAAASPVIFTTQSQYSTDVMLTALAHEIKNPTALALAYVALLRQTNTPTEADIYCNHIQRALMDINDITQNILFFHNQRYSIDCVNISTILAEIVSEYQVSIPHVTFLTSVSPNLKYLTCEKFLQLILSNLIKNAGEAAQDTASPGNVSIDVVTDNKFLTITIINDVRQHNTVKPNGNGLGLSICEGLIDKLQGTLQVKSNGNKCITTISLPCHASPSLTS